MRNRYKRDNTDKHDDEDDHENNDKLSFIYDMEVAEICGKLTGVAIAVLIGLYFLIGNYTGWW